MKLPDRMAGAAGSRVRGLNPARACRCCMQLLLVALLAGMAASAQAVNELHVAAIAARIFRAAGEVAPWTRTWQWHITLAQNPGVNAFSAPGNNLIINMGLLRRIDPPDPQLAFVLGHEVSHLVNNDYQNNALFERRFGGQGPAFLAFRRQEEYRADRMGMMLMARAGFDPRGAIAFLLRDEIALGVNPFANDSGNDHPSIGNRLANLRRAMPQAMQIYLHRYRGM